MDRLLSLFDNRILIAAVVAWTLAQSSKAVLYGILHRHFDWRRLLGDGGMPSAHSATVASAAAAAGMVYGFDSGLFALAVILAFITCHDAMNSRQQIGKQAVVIKKLASERETDMVVALKELVGHTPSQVLVGILLGIIIGLVVGLI